MIRIIVVEDEKAIRIGIVSMIERMDLDVQVIGSFGNGLEAVQFLTKQAVDVIITDISMPRMDGFELAEYVRQHDPETHIVILSGYNQFDYVRNALRSGVSDYLVKPVNKKELHQVLLKCIEHKAQERLRKSKKTDLLLRSYLVGELKADQLTLLWDSFVTYQQREMPCVCVVGSFSHAPTAYVKQRASALHAAPEILVCSLTSNLQMLIVAGIWDADEEPATASYERIALVLGLENGCRLGLSTVITRMEDWPRGFSEAMSAYCQYWHTNGKQTVIHYEEPSYPRSEITVMVSLIDGLLHNTSNWMNPDERKKLKGHLYRRAKRIEIRWEDLCRVLGYLLYQLRSRMSDATNRTFHSQGESSDLDLQIGEHAAMLDAIEDIFGRIDAIVAEMNMESGAYERKVVGTVKKIIDQAYHREIELSELANQVYLTANYVSFLFRKETGITITEYIMELRISKAKELLLTQLAMKTYEVGQAVGYPDAAYFNRLFKKVVGTTPRMYREQTHVLHVPN
ncbi:hypothetical protein A8709_16080 [Paenibacillus pectinilyticus]|uniref:DNA-binding response regulator n=1 Tax=Paenibacillus pectinilyticus TaxID=512399 RepID=A0A1C1A4V5_9BACL|nr:response regulator [Paenibacillus pectinilyticus]OCT15587.1 hypothetical protein A8709_16080 [Paenibacillus pectinilyticus]